MKPVDRRKAFRELRKRGRAQGINLNEFPGKGNGSHGSWIFTSASGVETVRIIVVYYPEISCVVQRSVVQNLRERTRSAAVTESARAFVKIVLDLVEGLFGS
ncbi:MAG: hypothetical protein ABI471_02135 [Sphingomonas bacterium]